VFCHADAPLRTLIAGTHELWSTRGPISVPDATPADAPAEIDYFPIDTETSFKLVTIPPESQRSPDHYTTRMTTESAKHLEPDNPGMHTTDTIDYVVILAGRVDLELDDGRKERLAAGDCVVQRGTRHAWRVIGEEPVVLAAVLIGARRAQAE
jgi:mannose-6-phosphate isomerase-like protein (cupin superfamily)